MNEKKIVFIDMDGVIVDFSKAIITQTHENKQLSKEHINSPDLIPEIFLNPEPIEGAIDAIKKLHNTDKYKLFIATTAPWDNPDSFTHKRLWIENHFKDLFRKKMFITHRKDLLMGDFLIDDRLKNGAENFKGELLRFGWDYEVEMWNEYPDWSTILDKLT